MTIQLKAARRMLALKQARDDLLVFNRLRMPDVEDPDDVTKSRFEITPLARLLCQVIQRAAHGQGKKRIAVSVGPQFGKALAVDTPIPTPQGFTPIGALCAGDTVFDEQGRPCSVVAKTPVWRDRPVYRVHTDDGFSVVADAEHDWRVRLSRSHPVYHRKTTRFLAERNAERNPLLAPSGATVTPDVDLPVDPYVLGVWLGDGKSADGSITAVGADGAFIEREIQSLGYSTRKRTDPTTFCVLGLTRQLAEMNLLRNKHIPLRYLCASAGQRLALLQGLVDTDGFVAPAGGVEFCNTNAELARGVRTLAVSLGVKSQMYYGRALLYGQDCGPKYRVRFCLDNAARLPRKKNLCRRLTRCGGRYLTFSEETPADTVCIEVDSPSHQFLCGEGMIATCNSDVLSRSGPAWIQGLFPHANQILGTYNQPMANEFGDAVREIMESPFYKQVFPGTVLRKKQTDLLVTTANGRMAFVGRGGSGTGKPADFFWVDDPIKDDLEAQSDLIRNEAWNWFNKVAMTRCHARSIVMVVHTRWHQDDLIGRLCDPEHPEREKSLRGVAKYWDYFRLPAVITDRNLAERLGLTLEEQTDPDVIAQFGAKPMTSLWPGRKSLAFLAEAKTLDPYGFSALYMGKPTADDGEFFRASDMVEYDPDELPQNLVHYGASDHAVSLQQQKDYTVIGCVGVDEQDNIWVLPDLVWDRMQTDRTVDEILNKMKTHKPAVWWMESELISKAFGPFLHKRMDEERTYCPIDPIVPSKDKRMMARSIQGRMQMRKVRFPRFAQWWHDAKMEMLRFDNGAHDDFVSFISMVGHGMFKQYVPDEREPEEHGETRTGSIEWILRRTRDRTEREKRVKAIAGW